jgi:hypothetical protein
MAIDWLDAGNGAKVGIELGNGRSSSSGSGSGSNTGPAVNTGGDVWGGSDGYHGTGLTYNEWRMSSGAVPRWKQEKRIDELNRTLKTITNDELPNPIFVSKFNEWLKKEAYKNDSSPDFDPTADKFNYQRTLSLFKQSNIYKDTLNRFREEKKKAETGAQAYDFLKENLPKDDIQQQLAALEQFVELETIPEKKEIYQRRLDELRKAAPLNTQAYDFLKENLSKDDIQQQIAALEQFVNLETIPEKKEIYQRKLDSLKEAAEKEATKREATEEFKEQTSYSKDTDAILAAKEAGEEAYREYLANRAEEDNSNPKEALPLSDEEQANRDRWRQAREELAADRTAKKRNPLLTIRDIYWNMKLDGRENPNSHEAEMLDRLYDKLNEDQKEYLESHEGRYIENPVIPGSQMSSQNNSSRVHFGLNSPRLSSLKFNPGSVEKKGGFLSPEEVKDVEENLDSLDDPEINRLINELGDGDYAEKLKGELRTQLAKNRQSDRHTSASVNIPIKASFDITPDTTLSAEADIGVGENGISIGGADPNNQYFKAGISHSFGQKKPSRKIVEDQMSPVDQAQSNVDIKLAENELAHEQAKINNDVSHGNSTSSNSAYSHLLNSSYFSHGLLSRMFRATSPSKIVPIPKPNLDIKLAENELAHAQHGYADTPRYADTPVPVISYLPKNVRSRIAEHVPKPNADIALAENELEHARKQVGAGNSPSGSSSYEMTKSRLDIARERLFKEMNRVYKTRSPKRSIFDDWKHPSSLPPWLPHLLNIQHSRLKGVFK